MIKPYTITEALKEFGEELGITSEEYFRQCLRGGKGRDGKACELKGRFKNCVKEKIGKVWTIYIDDGKPAWQTTVMDATLAARYKEANLDEDAVSVLRTTAQAAIIDGRKKLLIEFAQDGQTSLKEITGRIYNENRLEIQDESIGSKYKDALTDEYAFGVLLSNFKTATKEASKKIPKKAVIQFDQEGQMWLKEVDGKIFDEAGQEIDDGAVAEREKVVELDEYALSILSSTAKAAITNGPMRVLIEFDRDGHTLPKDIGKIFDKARTEIQVGREPFEPATETEPDWLLIAYQQRLSIHVSNSDEDKRFAEFEKIRLGELEKIHLEEPEKLRLEKLQKSVGLKEFEKKRLEELRKSAKFAPTQAFIKRSHIRPEARRSQDFESFLNTLKISPELKDAISAEIKRRCLWCAQVKRGFSGILRPQAIFCHKECKGSIDCESKFKGWLKKLQSKPDIDRQIAIVEHVQSVRAALATNAMKVVQEK